MAADQEQQQTDETLIVLALNCHSEALEQLVFRYEKKLLAFIFRKVGQKQTAEDLVQETFLRAFRNLSSFDCNFKFSTWIYTIARRLTISHYRKTASRPVTSFAEVEAVDRRTPYKEAEIADVSTRLWELARVELPQKQYDALVLRFQENLAVADIAKILDVSPANAKVLLHRGRKKLKMRFNETEGVS